MENVIAILVLTNGDQLLCSVTVDIVNNPYTYLVKEPLQIITHVDENGQGRMGIVPYLPYADVDAGIAVPTTMAILAIPSDELKNHHSERFGHIIAPSSKIIV